MVTTVIKKTGLALGLGLFAAAGFAGDSDLESEDEPVWPREVGTPGHFSVNQEILKKFPGMRFLILTARNIEQPSEEDAKMLQQNLEAIVEAVVAEQKGEDHENIRVWLEQLSNAGVNPKMLPSIAKLYKNGVRSINPLVDMYNVHSLNNVVCIGGYDLDALDDILTVRKGVKIGKKKKEYFYGLGSKNAQAISNQEIVFSGGRDNSVVTRHFVNIQAKKGSLSADTKNLFLISEVPNNVSDEQIAELRKGLVHDLETIFKADVRWTVMQPDDETIEKEDERGNTVHMLTWPLR